MPVSKCKDKWFDEKADPNVRGTEIIIDENEDLAMEMCVCPFCKGLFAVDWTYLEQVTNVIHCPMCCMEVVFEEYDE